MPEGKADVQVRIPGEYATVWFYRPVTEYGYILLDGLEWDSWQDMGDGWYALDHRPARHLAEYLKQNHAVVERIH